MLVVKPVQNKTVQRELIESCGGKYEEASLAYAACDCEDNETQKLRHIIGACQFRMDHGRGMINLLRTMPGVTDDEAMIIMARTAMNFLYRCEIQTAEILPGAADVSLIEKLGFRADENGAFLIDLKKFFFSPCHFQAE